MVTVNKGVIDLSTVLCPEIPVHVQESQRLDASHREISTLPAVTNVGSWHPHLQTHFCGGLVNTYSLFILKCHFYIPFWFVNAISS